MAARSVSMLPSPGYTFDGANARDEGRLGLPPGWDEARVRGLLEHYESHNEEQAVAEDQESLADKTQAHLLGTSSALCKRHRTGPAGPGALRLGSLGAAASRTVSLLVSQCGLLTDDNQQCIGSQGAQSKRSQARPPSRVLRVAGKDHLRREGGSAQTCSPGSSPNGRDRQGSHHWNVGRNSGTRDAPRASMQPPAWVR